jgi:hypothetical protein
MDFTGILIGTGILWVLTAIFVVPLSGWLVKNRLREPAFAHLNHENLDESATKELESLYGKYFILADVLVLGIAGFIAGLLGFWFIGIAWKAKAWPGMIAFMLTSIIISSMIAH